VVLISMEMFIIIRFLGVMQVICCIVRIFCCVSDFLMSGFVKFQILIDRGLLYSILCFTGLGVIRSALKNMLANIRTVDEPTQVGFSYSIPVPGYTDPSSGNIVVLPNATW